MGDSSPEPTNPCYTTSRGLDYTLHLGLWPRRSTPVHQSTTIAYQWLARLETRVFRFPDLTSVFLTVGDVSVMCLLLLGPATYVHTSTRPLVYINDTHIHCHRHRPIQTLSF